jgi:hypothetical protein
MKRFALLLTLILGSAVLYAQESKETDLTKPHDVTGTICDSKCVTQTGGQPACDASCTEKSGEPVFINDASGKVTKIANPDVCKGHMGKQVKMKARMMEDMKSMWILDIYG